jgi:hypothetical protein
MKEQDTALQPFSASRLALHHAVGDYIDEPDMTINEVIEVLEGSLSDVPALSVHESVEGWTGKQILEEIRVQEHDLINLMTIAHAAGKKGMEIV